MLAREQVTDRQGRRLEPGTRVRVLAEDGQPQGTVVRALPDYGVVTVMLEKPTKTERMYRVSEVEAL
jgi:hypothetical protein